MGLLNSKMLNYIDPNLISLVSSLVIKLITITKEMRNALIIFYTDIILYSELLLLKN